MKKTTKKLLCLALALVMVIGIVPFAAANTAVRDFTDFTDEANVPAEHREAADLLSALGIIAGVANNDGTYRLSLDRPIIRSEAAAFVARMMLRPEVADNQPTAAIFSDVPVGHWANSYIAYLYHQGVVAGVGDDRFSPDRVVTGFEMARMLLSAIGYGQNGEFVGDGWVFNVNTLARRENLGVPNPLQIDGVSVRHPAILSGVGDINFNNPATRLQVLQYMFNTLIGPSMVNWNVTLQTYVPWIGVGQEEGRVGTLGWNVFGLRGWPFTNDGVAYRVRQWTRAGVAAPLTAEYRIDVTVNRFTDGTAVLPAAALVADGFWVNGRQYIAGVPTTATVARTEFITNVPSARADTPLTRAVRVNHLTDGRVAFEDGAFIMNPDGSVGGVWSPPAGVNNYLAEQNRMDVLRMIAARRGVIVEYTAWTEVDNISRVVIIAEQGARIQAAPSAVGGRVTISGLSNTVPGGVPRPFSAASVDGISEFAANNISFPEGLVAGDHVLYFTDARGLTRVRLAESVEGARRGVSGVGADRRVSFGVEGDMNYFNGSQIGIETSIIPQMRYAEFVNTPGTFGLETVAWLDADGSIFAFSEVRVAPPAYFFVTGIHRQGVAGTEVSVTGITSASGLPIQSSMILGLTDDQLAAVQINDVFRLVSDDSASRRTVTLATIPAGDVIPLHGPGRFDLRAATTPLTQEFVRGNQWIVRNDPSASPLQTVNAPGGAETAFVQLNRAGALIGITNAPHFTAYAPGMQAWAVVHSQVATTARETAVVFIIGGDMDVPLTRVPTMFIGLTTPRAVGDGHGPWNLGNGNFSVAIVDPANSPSYMNRVTMSQANFNILMSAANFGPGEVLAGKLMYANITDGVATGLAMPTANTVQFGFGTNAVGASLPGTAAGPESILLRNGWWTGVPTATVPAGLPTVTPYSFVANAPIFRIAADGSAVQRMPARTVDTLATALWYARLSAANSSMITNFFYISTLEVPVPQFAGLAATAAPVTLDEGTALADANAAVLAALATPVVAPATPAVTVNYRWVNSQRLWTGRETTGVQTITVDNLTVGWPTTPAPGAMVSGQLQVPATQPWVVPVTITAAGLTATFNVNVTVTPAPTPLLTANAAAVLTGSSVTLPATTDVEAFLADLFDHSVLGAPMTWAQVLTLGPVQMTAVRTAGVGQGAVGTTSTGAGAVVNAMQQAMIALDGGSVGGTSTFDVTLTDPADGSTVTRTIILFDATAWAMVANAATVPATDFTDVTTALAAIPGVAAMPNYAVINAALAQLPVALAAVDMTDAATIANVNDLLAAMGALVNGPTDLTALTPAQLAFADAVTALVAPTPGFTAAQFQAFTTALDAVSSADPTVVTLQANIATLAAALAL